jgi:hypothetical protein
VLWWRVFKGKPLQMAGACIAFVLVCFCISIAVKPPKNAPGVQPQAGAHQTEDNTEARTTNIPAPHILAGEPPLQSASAYRNKNAAAATTHGISDFNRYLETVKTEVEKNFDQRSLDAPDGTSTDIAVVIRGNGHPGEPHLMMPSGYPGVDSACLQSVEQVHTFGVTPTFQNITVNFHCTVKAR